MQNKELLIYVALFAAAIGDAIPTAADAVYFNQQYRLKKELEQGIITPEHYWTWNAVYYYMLNPLYWLLLAAIVYLIKGDYHLKVKILLTLIAGGMVIGVISKNIKKDKESLVNKNAN